jgi:hypothetical protein
MNIGGKNTGNGNSGYGNSGYGNPGDWNSGDGNSGNGNSGNWNSGNWNSGDGNSGYWNSGDWNSGYWNSGDWNSGDGNSGNGNSGDWNSGYGNSTNRSSGIFCNSEPGVVCFGRDSGKKWDEINHPDFTEFHLTKWIEEKDMTNDEKMASPEFRTRGGYLKTYEYKEAWVNFWRDMDEENRQKFLNLPNFSREIFLDITGIDVQKPDDEVAAGTSRKSK